MGNRPLNPVQLTGSIVNPIVAIKSSSDITIPPSSFYTTGTFDMSNCNGELSVSTFMGTAFDYSIDFYPCNSLGSPIVTRNIKGSGSTGNSLFSKTGLEAVPKGEIKVTNNDTVNSHSLGVDIYTRRSR